ncbi:MAG TPA: cation:proton antiporter [Candidatus Methylomirabilis sp.]|nr:cation:proton antiporter [Candidatus Methylomirabilis sp.]
MFFVTVGLSLNFQVIDWSSGFIWLFSLTLTVLAVAAKLLSGFLIRGNGYTRFAIGLAMVPRGEVGLIFAELGRTSGIFSNEVNTAMVIVIALTTLLPPFAMKWLYRRFRKQLPPAHG